jgi:addiction module RelE/StbE family toxin
VHKVNWKKSVLKDLKKIKVDLQDKLVGKIEEDLSKNATHGEKLHGKFEGLYRRRIWEYRVIYAITPRGVLVLRVRHRRDAYK